MVQQEDRHLLLELTSYHDFKMFTALLQRCGFSFKRSQPASREPHMMIPSRPGPTVDFGPRLSSVTPLPGLASPASVQEPQNGSYNTLPWLESQLTATQVPGSPSSQSPQSGWLQNSSQATTFEDIQVAAYTPSLNPYAAFGTRARLDPHIPRRSSPLQRGFSELNEVASTTINTGQSSFSTRPVAPSTSTALLRTASFNSFSQSQRREKSVPSTQSSFLSKDTNHGPSSTSWDSDGPAEGSPSSFAPGTNANHVFGSLLPPSRRLPFHWSSPKRTSRQYTTDSSISEDRLELANVNPSAKKRRTIPPRPQSQDKLDQQPLILTEDKSRIPKKQEVENVKSPETSKKKHTRDSVGKGTTKPRISKTPLAQKPAGKKGSKKLKQASPAVSIAPASEYLKPGDSLIVAPPGASTVSIHPMQTRGSAKYRASEAITQDMEPCLSIKEGPSSRQKSIKDTRMSSSMNKSRRTQEDQKSSALVLQPSTARANKGTSPTQVAPSGSSKGDQSNTYTTGDASSSARTTKRTARSAVKANSEQQLVLGKRTSRKSNGSKRQTARPKANSKTKRAVPSSTAPLESPLPAAPPAAQKFLGSAKDRTKCSTAVSMEPSETAFTRRTVAGTSHH